MAAHSSILAGKFHGQWSLAGYSQGEPQKLRQYWMCMHVYTYTHDHKGGIVVCSGLFINIERSIFYFIFFFWEKYILINDQMSLLHMGLFFSFYWFVSTFLLNISLFKRIFHLPNLVGDLSLRRKLSQLRPHSPHTSDMWEPQATCSDQMLN